MKNLEHTPKIYVGSYGMYNNGSLFGKWMDLTEFSDRKEFYNACYEFHRNEFDSDGCRPELMFQDWEYIPDFLISESWLHEDAYKYFEAVAEMSTDRAEAFELYCNSIASWPGSGKDFDALLEDFNERYQGYFGGNLKGPKTAFAYEYIENIGLLSGFPKILRSYFDYEAYATGLFLDCYTEYEGHIFLDQ